MCWSRWFSVALIFVFLRLFTPFKNLCIAGRMSRSYRHLLVNFIIIIIKKGLVDGHVA
nr:MAG TPA: hypothetical protein [Caudoviricetes sp.]